MKGIVSTECNAVGTFDELSEYDIFAFNGYRQISTIVESLFTFDVLSYGSCLHRVFGVVNLIVLVSCWCPLRTARFCLACFDR